MYKVLIADDEDIIRHGLAGMVAGYPGFEVAALAEDGEIALEKAEETQPDLLLVDINMPFVNGFELIERSRAVVPDAEIVIITGYDNFEFIQRALQLGVADYILKPVMEEPFRAVLDRVTARLDAAGRSRKYLAWLTQQIEQNRPAMISEFFRSWLQSGMDPVEAADRMSYLRIQIPSPFCLSLLRPQVDPSLNLQSALGDWDDDLIALGCENIAKEILADSGGATCFRTEDGSPAVISGVFPEETWKTLTEKLTSTVRERLGVSLSVARKEGAAPADLPDVYDALRQEVQAAQRTSEPVLQALGIVNERWWDSELSLQSVADEVALSPQYLSRLFRRETGSTFGSFLTRKRITEATVLLQNSRLKMYEIAQKTGYTSQHYFSSAFKKELGISPAEYRRTVLGQEKEK